jgi:TolB-like protein
MKRILPLVLVLGALTSGCATQHQTDAHADNPALAVVTDSTLVNKANEGVDRLVQGLAKDEAGYPTVIVASLVSIDDLGKSSTFGRSVGEQVSARLAAHKVPVVETKLRESMLISKDGGEFLLTREAKELSASHQASVVVVGTYAETGSHVIVTLKALDAGTSRVVAGTTFAVPRGEVWNMLPRK